MAECGKLFFLSSFTNGTGIYVLTFGGAVRLGRGLGIAPNVFANVIDTSAHISVAHHTICKLSAFVSAVGFLNYGPFTPVVNAGSRYGFVVIFAANGTVLNDVSVFAAGRILGVNAVLVFPYVDNGFLFKAGETVTLTFAVGVSSSFLGYGPIAPYVNAGGFNNDFFFGNGTRDTVSFSYAFFNAGGFLDDLVRLVSVVDLIYLFVFGSAAFAVRNHSAVVTAGRSLVLLFSVVVFPVEFGELV